MYSTSESCDRRDESSSESKLTTALREDRNVEVVARTEGVGAFALAFPVKMRGRLVNGTTLGSESESEI